jgi:hypothetical protein
VCRTLAALRRRLIRKLLRTYRVEPDDDDGDNDDESDRAARRWRLLDLRLPPLTAGELERALEPAQVATALGHVGHLIALAARYACVRLPFPIAFCSSRSTIQLPADARRPAAGALSATGGGGRGAPASGGRSLPLYPEPSGGGGGADGGGGGGFGLGSISMLGASGGGGGAAGGAASGDEAQAQLARALLMLVANVHFLAVSCGLDRATPAAPAPGGGGGARAAASAGTFDALATLVRLSAASTLCWELRTARWPGAGPGGSFSGGAADGARLPGGADEVSAHAWGGALMAAIVYDADWDGRGGGAECGGGARSGGDAGAPAWRMAGVQQQHEWDLVERPRLPTPAQADDIAHWTRAMITDTIHDELGGGGARGSGGGGRAAG